MSQKSATNPGSQASGPPPYPRATIRLQFSRDFRFTDAESMVPYFAELGISHIYASPVLQARPGSSHGYDIVDHNHFNPEIGDENSYNSLCRSLHEYGMGLIMDFVPNHMGVGAADNEWWLDVLEWGKNSPFANFFDIDWDPVEASVKGKVLLPVLGDQYGVILENGELSLAYDMTEGSFSVWYYQHRFPIAVKNYAGILQEAAREYRPLEDYVKEFRKIGSGGRSIRQHTLTRNAADDLRQRLATELRRNPEAQSALERTIAEYNGSTGSASSFDRLDKLISQQAYRPAYWRLAANEINYRRFFDINDLAALRMEEPNLFDISHQLIFRLISEGKLQGIRLDHVDGLWDPKQYFDRLQDRASYALFESPNTGSEASLQPAELKGPDPKASLDQPFYILVEKILARHENLRSDWAVSGTTGYEFLNAVNGLQVRHESEHTMDSFYRNFTGRSSDIETMITEAKHLIMQDSLASELNVIANRLNRLAKQSRRTRDFSRIRLRQAFADITACFPVYRSYVSERGIDPDGRRDVEWAVAKAKKASNAPDKSVYDFLERVLTTDILQQKQMGYRKSLVMQIIMSAQQFTGPVMAKAVEDTVFYRFGRLISLNEVGGHPEHFGSSISAFHYQAKQRLQHHPFCMLASATHDHKRGEDTRARINVISEFPDEWMQSVERWAAMNERKKRNMDTPISAGDEYILYQVLVGTFPADLNLTDSQKDDLHALAVYRNRIQAYMQKVVREAKLHSSWTDVQQDYENGLSEFIDRILQPAQSSVFLADVQRLCRKFLPQAYVNGIMQTVLKLSTPGVPDIYQGTEFWDYSLVDPDNRHPVDYQLRLDSLQKDRLDPEYARSLLTHPEDGAMKLHTIRCLLGLRKYYADVFAEGEYIPLEVKGKYSAHVLAFLRKRQDQVILCAVPVQTAGMLPESGIPLPSDWADTELLIPGEISETLSNRDWNDSLTGRSIQNNHLQIAELFRYFPAAVLIPAVQEH